MTATDEESELYRDLMRFKPEDLTPNAWAVKAGVSRTVWTDMRRHGNPSRRTLEKLLVAAGSSLLEFEALRLGREPQWSERGSAGGQVGDRRSSWGGAQLPALPLLRSRLAGQWGEADSGIELIEVRRDELLDPVPRPPSLASDPGAFALTVVGVSMWPRFRSGARIAVSPQSAVAAGDDVLVLLSRATGGVREQALIMQLVERTTAALELRQFNPDRRVRLAMREVERVQRIVGELI